jgi:hypothetical protein
MTDPNQPTERDLILGGQAPPPMNGIVLGGIVGLQQQFALAPADEKTELIVQAINYGMEGINLLDSMLVDNDIKVRVTAYESLSKISTNAAKNAIANGIPIYPGDLIYHVYESSIEFDDCSYHIITSFETGWWNNCPKLRAAYLTKDKAEATAWKFHKHAIKITPFNLSDFGGESYYEDFCFGCDEVEGQMWLEVAGKLAFVEEEIVTISGYFKPFEEDLWWV